jgi:Pentapeptide repeats (8 copies)
MFLLHKDPEYKLHMLEWQQCARELGHEPSHREFDEWLSKKMKKSAAESAEHERRERERNETLRVEKLKRETILADRKKLRAQRPSRYSPPRDSSQLEQRSKDNQAFSEECKIIGEKGKMLRIGLDLENFNLSNSEFRHIVFTSEVNLSGANLRRSVFENVIFENGSKLEEADFDSVEIDNVIFKSDAALSRANFQFAKFKNNVSIEFDRNHIANATFYRTRRDSWYKLSSSYAGIWQFLNIALSFAYFCTILLKLYSFEALAEILPKLTGSIFDQSSRNTEFASVTTFQFIFGDQLASIGNAILLLFYQAFRVYLTTKISPLIESERQTGFTPDKYTYASLTSGHKLLRILGFIVVVLFLYHVYTVFQLQIKIPRVL